MTTRLQHILEGLKWGAILLGIVADQIGTIVAFFLLTIAGGLRQALLHSDFSATGVATPIQQVQFFLVGALLTFLGGLVTGKVAHTAEIANATIMGIGTLLCGIVLTRLSGAEEGPVWLAVAAYVVTVPLAVFGGYVALQHRTASTSGA